MDIKPPTEDGKTASGDPQPPKYKRLSGKLEHPNILILLAKQGLTLSARAQSNFVDVLDTLSTELRELFLKRGLIEKVDIDQRKAWTRVKNRRIGFVDGGVANISVMGAEPVAIRVGSYVVTPGVSGPSRERFGFEVQLVDELFESVDKDGGVYEDSFEDVSKMRDAARIVCETAGLLSLSRTKDHPDVIFLHGPLVNPVSPYALGRPGDSDAFPNFTPEALEILLAGNGSGRKDKDANFVKVYLDQLKQLATGGITVCGVVERPSSSVPGPLISKLIRTMQDDGIIPAASFGKIYSTLRSYQITDSLIFECILDEGEYVLPTQMDKQGADSIHLKIPLHWYGEIVDYPRPWTTYVKANSGTMPVRLEFFMTGTLGNDHGSLLNLVVHMSRLLPKYSFPVGLDIVDKHAKIPNWMSRQVSSMLAAKLMKKAMDTNDPQMVKLVRRVLSSNTRDWLFRPEYNEK